MTTPIVFIDIDGTLLPDRVWMSPDNHTLKQSIMACKRDGKVWYNDWELKKQVRFDGPAVTFFNAWIEFSGAKIVVSSSWTFYTSKEQLQELFTLNGLRGDFHEDWTMPDHFTPRGRCSDLSEWLSDHPEVENYLVVDDDTTVHGLVEANKQTAKHAKTVLKHWKHKAKQGEYPTDPWDTFQFERALNPHYHKMAGKVIEVDSQNGITLAQFYEGCKILNIDVADIYERWYGVKKLTPEEQQERDDLLMSLIC